MAAVSLSRDERRKRRMRRERRSTSTSERYLIACIRSVHVQCCLILYYDCVCRRIIIVVRCADAFPQNSSRFLIRFSHHTNTPMTIRAAQRAANSSSIPFSRHVFDTRCTLLIIVVRCKFDPRSRMRSAQVREHARTHT